MVPTVALYHHLPPGGAERAMYELVRETADEFRYIQFRIDLDDRDPFATSEGPPIEDLVEVRSFPARAGGASRIGRWGITVPHMLRAERRIAAAINADTAIDAVVTHHQRFLQVPGIHRAVDRPSVYFVQEPRRRSFEYQLRHATSRKGRASNALLSPLETWAARHDVVETRAATALLCNSEHSREYVWRAYGRDATVVRLGVDAEKFALRSEALPRANEVLAVGSLDPTKGHDLAIRAVGLIDEASRPRLRIVANRADPRTRSDLVDLAASLAVDLEIEEDLDDDTLVRRYQEAAAVLLTARVEPLGLTSLEAMACGTPVVAVREGGYRETVVDGVGGHLCDRDPVALAAGMTAVLDGAFTGQDAAIRSSVVDRFSWATAAVPYRRTLQAVLDGTASSGDR